MFARRRPLATAAVIGGAAYVGSKKGAQSGQAQNEAAQAQQAPVQAAPAAPAEPEKDPMETLKELAALHEQGVLTDAEFEIQKTKILQSM